MQKKEPIFQDLSPEDASLAERANLGLLLSYIHKDFFKTQVGPRTLIAKYFVHTEEEKKKIEQGIIYVLELIDQDLNPDYKADPYRLYKFFSRKQEQEGFIVYLFKAIQTHKCQQMEPVEFEGQIVKSPYINDAHLWFRQYEDKKAKYFEKDGVSYTEKQLFAAAIYYMFRFLVDALRENDARHLCSLLIRINHFLGGVDYIDYSSKTGGRKGAVSRKKNRKIAYDIFLKKNIYQKCQINENTKPKNYLLAQELHKILPKNMKVTLSTVQTSWIPIFIKWLEQQRLKEKHKELQGR